MSRKINYFDEDYDEQVKNSPSLTDLIRNSVIRRKQGARGEQQHNTNIKNDLKKAVVFGEKAIKNIAHDVAVKVSDDDGKRGLRFVILLAATIIILGIMVGSVVLSFHHQNSKNQKFCDNAGEVCADYIVKYGNCNYENLYDAYSIMGYRMTGLCYARQLDFDSNGTDELLVCYDKGGEYFVEVWGYDKNKKFANLYHGRAAQSKNKADDAWVTIYYKNNKYYIGSHNNRDITKVDLYQLKGDEFEKKKSCTYDEQLEAFIIKDKVQYESFERIKLAVLNEQKAIVTVNLVSDVLDDFTSEDGVISKTVNGKSMKNSYNEVVQKLIQNHGAPKLKTEDGYSYIDGVACVKQVDFDGDDRNELLVAYRKPVRVRDIDSSGNYIAVTRDTYYCEIYKYNGKNAVMVYQKDNVSNLLNDSKASYIVLKKNKKKTYICSNSFSSENYSRIVNAKSSIMRFDGERFVSQHKSSYRTEYGYTRYYIDDESVYRSEFNEKGYAVPFFDGESNYDREVFDVIFLQQRTDDAKNMDTLIAETNNEIAKLK